MNLPLLKHRKIGKYKHIVRRRSVVSGIVDRISEHFPISKTLLTIIFLFAGLIGTSNVCAQKGTLNLNIKNQQVKTVLKLIEEQSDFKFFYNNNQIDEERLISLTCNLESISSVLGKIFKGTDVSFSIVGQRIVLTNNKITVNPESIPNPEKTKVRIRGTVTDEAGEPAVGAAIREEGPTSRGTVADDNGVFSLDVDKGSTVQISYIGFKSQSFKIDEDKVLNIKLVENIESISEIVVVGYGVSTKESLTGAINNLTNDQIEKTKSTSLAQAVQGKVAGLQIRQQSGEPGKFESSINIRGFGTPLFIIDGVVRDGSTEFQRLNPDEIESISFLKDATAAIYGMNSSNGAVIVTTKKGTKGKPRITLNANYGIAQVTDMPEMANAAQYQTMMNEAWLNAGRSALYTKDELAKWQSGAPGYESYNYYDAIFNDSSPQYQTTFSIEGGNDQISYFGSLGYANENSLLKNNAITYDKYTFRSNVNLKVTRDLTASINLSGMTDNRDTPYESFFTIFKSTRVNPPTQSLYANNNPNYYNYFSYEKNSQALIDSESGGYARTINKSIQSQFSLEYDVPYVEGLKIKGMLSYDFTDQKYKALRRAFNTYVYQPYKGVYDPQTEVETSSLTSNDSESDRLDIQLQLNYKKTFASDHSVAATYVFERRDEKSNYRNTSRDYDFYTVDEINFGKEQNQQVSGSSDDRSFLSHIGRFNYAYKGKYLLELAFRYDGSYRYEPSKRWAFFPTGSIGWRISEENFWKEHIKFVDNFKLRASAGRSGEDAGDAFQYIEGYTLKDGSYSFEDGVLTDGAGASALTNQNLTWIKTELYDVGFDFSILKGLFSLEFDLFQRNRNGLLAYRTSSLPNTFGATLPQENLEGDRTRGIDFTVSHRNRIGEVKYQVGANFSLARTKNIYKESSEYRSSYDRWKNQTANRWSDFIWGYQTDGRYTNENQINSSALQGDASTGNSKELPGDYILMDVNGDGLVNSDDQTPLFWSGTPLIHYGFNIEVTWRNFDFYALLQGSANYTVQFDEVYAKMLCFKGGNTPAYFFDRWHKADPYDANSEWIAGEWPAIRLEQDMGAFYTRNTQIWRKDASYLRLKTIELGYTFSQKLLAKVGIQKCRIYTNVYNLYTWCDSFVKMFDPEKIEGAYSAGFNYPLTKSYNFGLTLNF